VSPIEFDEFFGDRADWQVEFAAIVASMLDREIGNCHQQGIFISGDKLALRQKSLDLAQERNLVFRRWTRDCSHLVGPRFGIKVRCLKYAVVQCRNSSRKAWTRVVLRPTWRRDPAERPTGSVMR
jgi:hypothetical protein